MAAKKTNTNRPITMDSTRQRKIARLAKRAKRHPNDSQATRALERHRAIAPTLKASPVAVAPKKGKAK